MSLLTDALWYSENTDRVQILLHVLEDSTTRLLNYFEVQKKLLSNCCFEVRRIVCDLLDRKD